MVVIKTRILKLSLLLLVVGVTVPSNIFVYGTSDTQYTENVTSTIEIEDIELNSEVSEKVKENTEINSDVADVLGVNYNENNTQYMIYAKELAEYDIAIQTDDSTAIDNFENLDNISVNDLESLEIMQVENIEESNIEKDVEQLVALEDLELYSGPSKEYDVVGTLKEEDPVEVTNIQKDGFSMLSTETCDTWVETELLGDISEIYKHKQGTALIEISIPDVEYNGGAIELTPEDRDICERLVMGEAGGQGFEGAALVAQALRDSMLYKGFSSVNDVRVSMGYTASLSKTPNQDSLDAVAFIFDEGGYVVRHKIYYFYAPRIVRSSFHESRTFVIEYKQHRFFS